MMSAKLRHWSGVSLCVPNESIAFLASSRNSSLLRSSSDVATIWMSGASSDWSRYAKPGISLRFAKSPVAPNRTIT
ncbi:hypothetical protein PICSAR240_02676 [Mycobacterium avium subsp. paratuberculosis]|nr:hypothetical protein B0172_01626 [Mycobacterium avium subsp. paratuberculosis]OVF05358.1 hypothetical protein B0173_01083 [Mycobacterium avium subsp. paratuberculosis]QKU45615.1 hypothetical protein MAP44135_2233 [Mycobacterium avium subsp. paratuberculosis]CAG6852085.1 hypothetical protein PICSAR113_00175 [Mycobacterium avium subsp. paratuberculosis]CAG6855783.1 hypothetical protein PICSAR124B_00412 [Mycobacterium avium subsp. paratuberculosis]